ncbi:MAG: isoprenylcysteine carboxylmethyltransferase family protein [Lautropia sp.]
MNALELKIHPPVVAAAVALVMWALAWALPLPALPGGLQGWPAVASALAGVAIALAAIVSFRRARTTVDPRRPEQTSAVVSSGIYRITRNPMYLGVLLVLLAWALRLGSAAALLGPPAFLLYIDRFQIRPEERLLTQRFGSLYTGYRARVRRWL